MRFNALFFTSTILFVASIDASSTKVDQHELQRFLRGDTKPQEEERGVFDAVEASLNKIPLGWLSKIAEDVSNFNRRDGAEYNLLKSEEYKKMYDHMAATTLKTGEDLDTHMATVLAAQVGNDVFARILQASRNDPVSKEAAVKLQMGLMRSWEMEVPERSASALFDHLFPRTKGEKIPDDLIRNPLFKLWYKYVTTMMRQRNQNMSLDTVKILAARYGKDDFVTMFEASLKADDTKEMVSLRVRLLDDLVSENTSIKDVYDTFGIGEIGVDDLLDSAAFKIVSKYSTLFSEINPDSRFDLINAIMVDGRDASVAKMLYAAKVEKEADEIKRMLPRELQSLQYETWYEGTKGLPTIKNMLGINEDPKKSDPAGAKVWKEFVQYKDDWDWHKAQENAYQVFESERLRIREKRTWQATSL